MALALKGETMKADFDDLSDSAFVRVPVVADIFNCSVATIWRWTKDGRIPSPRKLSPGFTAWKVGDLRAMLGSVK